MLRGFGKGREQGEEAKSVIEIGWRDVQEGRELGESWKCESAWQGRLAHILLVK